MDGGWKIVQEQMIVRVNEDACHGFKKLKKEQPMKESSVDFAQLLT